MTEIYLPPYVLNEVFDTMPLSQSLNWAHAYIGIDYLHSLGFTGRGIHVGIVDTGIEEHEDLIDNLESVENVSGELWGTGAGHGTAVAGILAAVDNNLGIKGMAPQCRLHAIKAMRENGGGSYSNIVDGIRKARQKGCRIINLSLGGATDSGELRTEIENCAQEGILLVCAAGNSGKKDSVMFPARYAPAYAVGAINDSGKTSAFSSRGWDLDLSAPGEKLLTTYKENTYALVSGTSYSAPIVSGVFACLLQAGVKITHDLIYRTCIDIDEPGLDANSGYGVVSPERLFKEASVNGDGSEDDIEYAGLKVAYYYVGKFLRDKGVIV